MAATEFQWKADFSAPDVWGNVTQLFLTAAALSGVGEMMVESEDPGAGSREDYAVGEEGAASDLRNWRDKDSATRNGGWRPQEAKSRPERHAPMETSDRFIVRESSSPREQENAEDPYATTLEGCGFRQVQGHMGFRFGGGSLKCRD
ncbi:hypothetical protein NDU88_004729 [Pleurodeles waltl]|uniref:Uncharacterized protein n=1 Tax=Pleurodeles waltl TaxID=8319 RepID=A0AAV7VHV7_PLEWA|nr:hypothetical protein NDU88_004729 [Pleurodeles waltl]